MSARERVGRTRQALATAIVVRAVLDAATALLIVLAIGTAVTRRGTHAPSGILWALGVGAAIAAFAFAATPWRRLTTARVALWIEERRPSLRYALVTAVDPAHAGTCALVLLEREVARETWGAETRAAIARSLRAPAIALGFAIVALVTARRIPVTAAGPDGRLVTATSALPTGTASPFAKLTATVRPPAYTRSAPMTITSPASIGALVGSSVLLEAPGGPAGIFADVGGQPVPVATRGAGWAVAFSIGERPTVVRLRHAVGERVIALEPRIDSAPSVRLTSPLRDTVFRVAEGTLALRAEVADDIGLVSGAFEYIVSSGEGESFQFRSGTLGARRFGGSGASAGSLAATMALATLALKPGDIVHLRAVARDGNTVTGPGVGSSETRVIRVARASEYDTLAVEGAPPPEADKSLISQRMLIILTEALERKRPRIARESLLAESRDIGRDQTRLRKRVGDIIFARLGDDPTGEHGHGPDEEPADEPAPAVDSAARDSSRRAGARAGLSPRAVAAADSADSARAALLRAASAATSGGDEILDFHGDETPVVAINRPLLEAYNAMWEASRELDQGETGRALPPMRRALAAIQRARQAERIYLRGKAPAVVVDLARVRLTGKDTGAASTRGARPAADPAAARRAERLARAIALAQREPSAAIDSLVMLRVESLDVAPALAMAIADAVDALRSGRNGTSALARARRSADGSARGAAALRPWSGVW